LSGTYQSVATVSRPFQTEFPAQALAALDATGGSFFRFQARQIGAPFAPETIKKDTLKSVSFFGGR
jgi:hypothetical protein